MTRIHRATANLDEETAHLLKRIAAQEFRSESSTLALLVRQEAAKRGMLSRAPTLVVKPSESKASE